MAAGTSINPASSYFELETLPLISRKASERLTEKNITAMTLLLEVCNSVLVGLESGSCFSVIAVRKVEATETGRTIKNGACHPKC